MSITKNVFTLKKAYELIVDGQWALFNSLDELTAGELWAWGDRFNIGLNSVPPSDISSPTQIPGNTWLDICGLTSAPALYSIKTDGTLWAFGSPNTLGLNDTIRRSSPSQIPGTNWVGAPNGVSSGVYLAIKGDNTMWGWGNAYRGSFAVPGFIVSYSSPTQIPGNAWCQASARVTSHGIKTDGTLWAWGACNYGALGIPGSHTYSPTLVGGNSWLCVESFTDGATALKTDGTLWIWGRNTNGVLGLNDSITRSSPTQIPGNQWIKIQSQGNNDGKTFLAIKSDGTLWSWGCNQAGKLGLNDNIIFRSSPTQIPGTQWKFVTVDSVSGAIKTDGTLWTWGEGSAGKLGLNNTINRSSPTQIPGTNWIGPLVNTSSSMFAKKLP